MCKFRTFLILFVSVCLFTACEKQPVIEWVATTGSSQWELQSQPQVLPGTTTDVTTEIFPQKELQTVSGFGACFNELGWTSLSLLPDEDKNRIFEELFYPGKGANFTICRMPVGANDFARNWYSYNETESDFEMRNFSIANDEETLIPFIHTAKGYNPELKIWASPWCPPAWMKYVKHYACKSDPKVNDLPGPRIDREGTDMFIQEDPYLKAYALYFGKFIDAYAAKGINIFAVAPQNEFNSCQNFPSCTWTSAALANFIGKYLGPEMEKRNVDIMFGTMERPNVALVDTIMDDPLAGKYIKSIGFQWAGKRAIPEVHKRYPHMPLYQTEQECGNGKNDWKFAVYVWDLMRHYFSNGANVYTYWNISLEKGGISRWGWAQNSLVVVDPETKQYNFTFEYYVMKHYSHYVLPGAKRIETSTGYEDLIAFKNTDGSIVLLVGNPDETEKTISIKCDDRVIRPVLKSNSLNTIVLRSSNAN